MTRSWHAPAGLATRGTIVLLPGRGEHAGVYERFGRRLSSDAYAVHVLDVTADHEATAVRNQVDALAAAAVTPLVLAGSDTGALRVLELIRDGVAPDGLLLVGLPDPDETVAAGDWDWELAARTTCPAHRARLADDEDFVRGGLADPVPAPLAAALDETVLKGADLPALVLHGGADPIAPVTHAARVAELLPRAELAVVGPAPHDVLNDAAHRTVAAQIVQWLERLRGGPQLDPILSVLSASAPPRA